MTTSSVEAVVATTRNGMSPQPPNPFAKPAPGSWSLDLDHVERPLPRFMFGQFEKSFTRGFREGFAAYGVLLDTIEAAVVNGFMYACVRPIGAPPEAKGTPPKAVFKLITTLHPEIRRRVRLSQQAISSRLWRTEVEQYHREWAPPVERETRRLLDAPVDNYSDAELAEHVEACYAQLADAFYVHHRMNCARIIPVGDFIAHARGWTGATVGEILEAFRGTSPHSREGLDELAALATLVREDETLLRRLELRDDPEELLADLEGRNDAVGNATRRWIGTIGHRVTGFSLGYPTLRENPSALVESIRGMLLGEQSDDAEAAGRRAAARLRERVPAEHRDEFDALYEEARALYPTRDLLCFRTLGTVGAVRVGLLAAGRRLANRGRITEPEAALDATVDELRAMLLDDGGPSAEELASRLAWRRSATSDVAPRHLGPAPGAPPPDDWFPKGALRLQRAANAYIRAMSDEPASNGVAASEHKVVRGLSASGGKRIGTARLVLAPGDFDRIAPGDVLVARITTPSYNVLLPMLAGIVTDRGGVLSHPAIVSREYGIPGVVGTRNATTMIPDGATVEVDGDAGIVRVLS